MQQLLEYLSFLLQALWERSWNSKCKFTLIFCLTTGIIKKLLSITRNKKKKHDKTIMLGKSKFNSIGTLVAQGLIDVEISHKYFVTILNERD